MNFRLCLYPCMAPCVEFLYQTFVFLCRFYPVRTIAIAIEEDKLEARPNRLTTVLFESTFWRTYRRHRGHLGCWYDMVVPFKDMEMLLFPDYQDSHWTLFEVSGVEEVSDRRFVPSHSLGARIDLGTKPLDNRRLFPTGSSQSPLAGSLLYN
jgi:hypothetical protein